MARKNIYQHEIDAIVTARKAKPEVGAYVLARELHQGRFAGQARTYYSILSVIRRYDDQQRLRPTNVAA